MYLWFRSNLRNEKYRALMKLCINRSDAVMFVFANYDDSENYQSQKKIWQEQLADSLIKCRHNPVWPSTELAEYTGEIDVCIYRLTKTVKKYIMKTESLYAWNYPHMPEDITFLNSGMCIFGINAHEEYAFIQDTAEARCLLDSNKINYNIISGDNYFEKY